MEVDVLCCVWWGSPGEPLNVLRLWPESNLGQLAAILPAGE
jgi:hypothetical protein